MSTFSEVSPPNPRENSSISESSNFGIPVTSTPVPWGQQEARGAVKISKTSSFVSTPTTPHTISKRHMTPAGDRFIPNRTAMDIDVSRFMILEKEDKKVTSEDENSYRAQLARTLLNRFSAPRYTNGTSFHNVSRAKVLSFSDRAPDVQEDYINPNRVLYSQNAFDAGIHRNKVRHIPQKPEKILDAPGMLEDFYLNLVDWGSNNILAVGLANSVYIWNATNANISRLCHTLDGSSITSVSWLESSSNLAVGFSNCQVQIWDVNGMRLLRSMRSHRSRVGALAWNSHILSSSSRVGEIHNHDVRISRHHVATLPCHNQEVCGLKWSSNGTQLASGSNDNTVCIWDMQSGSRWHPRYVLQDHRAAIKALAWSPWQSNLLATGGGSADRRLRFWNSNSGICMNSVDTQSQICSIIWSPSDKELLTSHGFSQNQLVLWKYPSLTQMAELKGHTSRVLHTALSPDGKTVVSGAADETLRFWKVFTGREITKRKDSGFGRSGLSSRVRVPSIR